jgi:hypothetical protein
MADEWIKVGSSFTVTMDTRDPVTHASLITLTDYTGHAGYYKRPDGKTGVIQATSHTADVIVITIPVSLNPLTGRAGQWEFYPYCLGSGSIAFHGKEDFVVVHPQFRNQT